MNAFEDLDHPFKSIVEASPNALILVDAGGYIIYLNKIAAKLFQYSKNELTGEILETIIPISFRHNHPSNREGFMNSDETREMGKGRDLLALRKDGTEFPAEIGLHPVKIENNRFVIASIIDITERKKNESEILLKNKLLAELAEKLHSTNVELEKKNSDLNQSIEYAHKIQHSILPDISEIQNKLPNFHIYFAPKNIIGGDFYWFYQFKDISYIAAIDCTGHSVPGAMISMIIHSLLNEIMLKNTNNTTGEILGSLHKGLYELLQQDKGEAYTQDGCDISLCKINKEKMELQFSGARQDLYICQNNSVSIIKSSSNSIGGYSMIGRKEPERKFETKDIPISPNMLIAMPTDGILDQLNERDEVFGIKHFTNLITKNYSLPVDEAAKNTREVIDSWKQNISQQDDMLMMMFKCI